ncbi:MAG TPA: tetratricopeptide repeat protein [Kofleriaceae bacterium]|nr:tetratricopeptide repeat protein [Kofleriaceae bacterium]
MGILRVLVATITVTGALAAAAHAQPAAPNDKQKAQAGDLVKKAIAKSQTGDHQTAIELYLQAYQIAPLPILLSNIGSEFQQEGKPVEALKYFCWYLKDDPTGANVTYATANVKALHIQLGHEVDDKDVCKPTTEKKPPEPVISTPPPTPIEPPPGPTTPPTTGTPITGGTPGNEPSDTSPRFTNMQLAGLVVGGAGVLAFGIGTYYGIAGWQLSNKISDHSMTTKWETNIGSEESEGQSDNNKQIGFMIAGGVAAGAGVVMYLLGHKGDDKDKEHVMLVPTGTQTSVGVALSRGF